MRNTLIKNNGFTLVELMVVCGIMSGMALVMNQMMLTMTKANAKAQQDSEVMLTISEVSGILYSSENCKSTLDGKNALNDITVNAITRKGVQKFLVNTPYGNSALKIKDYNVSSTAADLATGNAKLTLNFEKKALLGGGTLSKVINLYVEVDGSNNITKCRALAPSGNDTVWVPGNTIGDVNFAGGNVGVGESNPVEKLEVAGAVKVGFTTTSCNASTEGVFRSNKTSHNPEYCDGSSWISLRQPPPI